jgi:hypothetical protein
MKLWKLAVILGLFAAGFYAGMRAKERYDNADKKPEGELWPCE